MIAGDGVGAEVVPAGRRVLERAAVDFRLEWTDLPWGSEHYLQTGRMMPADALERVLGARAVRTRDLGGEASTDEVADAVLAQIS